MNVRMTVFSLALTICSHVIFSQQLTMVADQNPNAARSLERYALLKDSLLQNQGETIQATYTASQPWFDAWDARQQWKIDRIEFRKQLRLERARRPVIRQTRRPWVMPYGGGQWFDNDWRWRYGWNFGIWPW